MDSTASVCYHTSMPDPETVVCDDERPVRLLPGEVRQFALSANDVARALGRFAGARAGLDSSNLWVEVRYIVERGRGIAAVVTLTGDADG